MEATKKKKTTTTATKVATKVEKAAPVAKPKVIPVEPEPEVQVSVYRCTFQMGSYYLTAWCLESH